MSAIRSHILRDDVAEITVLSMGGAVQNWVVGGRSVVLGYQDAEAYRSNPMSMGIIVGRVANRISNAAFEMNGTRYDLATKDPAFQLHGGPGGIGWQNWDMTPEGDRSVLLTLQSPDGDQGFPGAVDFEVRMTLEGGALTWEMRATPDQKTPINLAQHLYFNLGTSPTIRDHRFCFDAPKYTPNTPALIPTGEILPVQGTRYDFRSPQTLTDQDPAEKGYDLNLVLGKVDGPKADVTAPDGMRLQLWTNRPGLQFYTSNTLETAATPLLGQVHERFGGFCIEAQDFPNALNTPGFGSILYTPDAPYKQVTTIKITS